MRKSEPFNRRRRASTNIDKRQGMDASRYAGDAPAQATRGGLTVYTHMG